ncbi:hypothetical protein BE964_00445 (plasmid) [Escherichia coli]|uniref:DNA replication protein n=5 Tax=Gammaproteobacteria TaxID=1236 RepID=A0A7M1HX64_ECOLX|nr:MULTISPECIES: hypothetical protein [Gammaproteobacteria]ASB81979.1 hypothetical protein AM383_00590 [Enterobacter cloacae complex sp.]AUV04354.1 hypothetical protein C2U51_25875 [Enterobacteriaceae bacterium ENNIH1]AUV04831.1 hypothetical protein C2U52_00305 [Enterobacteriaceae bacterium ENNIH2]AUY17283.1 hypothetical protein C3F38_25940 [Serratia sp. SSNIH1]AUY35140.1 hypothetical protein C3F42_18825 [Pseudomonas sp. PONIH3]AVL21409.1 hypothetical protein B2J95_26060 [Enterobacter cloacae
MGSCAAPSAKGDDKFITTDYLQQCQRRVILICRFFTRLYRPSLKDVLWLCVIFACVLSPC